MPLHILGKKIGFPPPADAMEDGLLAASGDLSVERLLYAYRHGIFPWYEDDVPLWWCPDPRFVLFPEKLRVSKSMQQIIKQKKFQFTINKSFPGVIHNCKNILRNGQQGTWITNEVEKAYIKLHTLGYAHSAEAWLNDKLVGGLYGIRMQHFFFGESMFSYTSNASKFAFIQYAEQLKKEGVLLIDCQVYTQHLESLGAEMISRERFLEIIKPIRLQIADCGF